MADINVIMDEGALDELVSTNDDVITNVAEAVAENADKFEFDWTSGLVGAGMVILAHLGYKYIPLGWKKLTEKFDKKTTDNDEDDDDDDIDDDEDDDSDEAEATEGNNESKDDETTEETSKPNRAERRNKNKKNKNKK